MSRFQPRGGQSRSLRDSSPKADDYHTGVSSINLEEALHSTQQFDTTEQDQERWPSQWDREMARRGSDGSDGSASMSIELGRGVKRAGDELDDGSSNPMFTFGDNSQYELTETPPLKNMARKSNGDLRRVASIRKASEGTKRVVSRTVSGQKAEPISLQSRIASKVAPRFTRKAEAPIENTTTDIAVPDFTGVSGLINPRMDSTSRSDPAPRFTPKSTYRMPVRFEGPEHRPIPSVPIPEDEKKIYAALQALQEKVNQLEQENDEMAQQMDGQEKENIRLRNALAREEQLRRPDSALGSEDETAKEKWRLQRTELQQNVRTLTQQLSKTEQRAKGRDEELRRLTQEKQDLVTQLGVECYRVQEIESENMALREDNGKLRAEVERLRQQVYNSHSSAPRSLADDLLANRVRRGSEKTHARPARQNVVEIKAREVTINFDNLDAQSRFNIAEAVKQQHEQQRQRRAQTPGVRSSMFDLELRSRKSSYPQHRAAVQDDTNEAYTEFELTKDVTHNLSRRSMQDLEIDMTSLTVNDPLAIKDLRQRLEAERRAGHLRRHSSVPLEAETTGALPKVVRRSSLRDPAELPKEPRTVRVQSPAADDLTDASLPARPEEHENGETSEFIVPDITLHRRLSRSDVQEHSKLNHNAASCTVCNNIDINSTAAPPLTRISARTDLSEDATVRPSQPPQQALSAVLKQLHDELDHLKLVLAKYQQQHATNEPAIGARERQRLYAKINEAMAEVKRKEDQIYALYDALEGQMVNEAPQPVQKKVQTKVKRAAMGYDGAYDGSEDESVGLPDWEGLSDGEH